MPTLGQFPGCCWWRCALSRYPCLCTSRMLCAFASPCLQETYCVAGDVRPCPYAGAKFPVTMVFPPTYPFKLPQVVHCSRQSPHRCCTETSLLGRATAIVLSPLPHRWSAIRSCGLEQCVGAPWHPPPPSSSQRPRATAHYCVTLYMPPLHSFACTPSLSHYLCSHTCLCSSWVGSSLTADQLQAGHAAAPQRVWGGRQRVWGHHVCGVRSHQERHPPRTGHCRLPGNAQPG